MSTNLQWPKAERARPPLADDASMQAILAGAGCECAADQSLPSLRECPFAGTGFHAVLYAFV